MNNRIEIDPKPGPDGYRAPTPGDDRDGTGVGGQQIASPVVRATRGPRRVLYAGAYLLAIGWAVSTGALKALAVIAAIFLMIMLHELGHYVTARWAGMKVTEFFLGFGPRLWSFQRGETEYGIKAVPLGGYVKIVGMSNIDPAVEPEDESRAYRSKPYWRRLSVAVAGSTMHFLIAFVLLLVLHGGFTLVRSDAQPTLRIGAISTLVTGEAPAQQAGLRQGDLVISVAGQRITEWDQIKPLVQPNAGKPILIVVERGGQQLTLTATPVARSTIRTEGTAALPSDGQPDGFLGIGPEFPQERPSILGAPRKAVADIGTYSKLSVLTLGKLASPHGLSNYLKQVTGAPPAPETTAAKDTPRFLSPIGLANVAEQAANDGLVTVLLLLININIFVGIFNMIPLPPFDGGLVAVATYERIRSRKGRPYVADAAKLLPVAAMVLMALMFLFVTSVILDVRNPL